MPKKCQYAAKPNLFQPERSFERTSMRIRDKAGGGGALLSKFYIHSLWILCSQLHVTPQSFSFLTIFLASEDAFESKPTLLM